MESQPQNSEIFHPWFFGTDHIDEKPRLRRAWPYALSCQSLHCSYKNLQDDKNLDPNLDL